MKKSSVTPVWSEDFSEVWFTYGGPPPACGKPLGVSLTGLDECPAFIQDDFDAAWENELEGELESGEEDVRCMVDALKATAWRWGVDLQRLAYLLGVDVYRSGDDDYAQAGDVEWTLIEHSISEASARMQVGGSNLNVRLAEVYTDEDERQQAFQGNAGFGSTLYAEAEVQATLWRQANSEIDAAAVWEMPQKERGVPYPIDISFYRDVDACEADAARRYRPAEKRLRTAYVRAMLTLEEEWRTCQDVDFRREIELQAVYMAWEWQAMLTNKNGREYQIDLMRLLTDAMGNDLPFRAMLRGRMAENMDIEIDDMLDRTLSSGDELYVPEELAAAPYLAQIEEELAQQAHWHAQAIHSQVAPAWRSLAFNAGFQNAAAQGIPYGECILAGAFTYVQNLGFTGTFDAFWNMGTTAVHGKAEDGHTTVLFGKLLKRIGEMLRAIPTAKAAWLDWRSALDPNGQRSAYWRARGRAIRYAEAEGDAAFYDSLQKRKVTVLPARPVVIRLAVDPQLDLDDAPHKMQPIFWQALAQAGAQVTDDIVWITLDKTITHMADRFGHRIAHNGIANRYLAVTAPASTSITSPAFWDWTTRYNAAVFTV